MNLKSIFENTDFVHASGTKEELQVAEYLKGQFGQLGVKAWLEDFRVAMGDIEEAHLYADGTEIECKAFACCGSGSVEGELYYMPGLDKVSIAGAKDKIVLLDVGGVSFSHTRILSRQGRRLYCSSTEIFTIRTRTLNRGICVRLLWERQRSFCAP